MVLGGFEVVCGGLRWFVVVCRVLWWFVEFKGDFGSFLGV